MVQRHAALIHRLVRKTAGARSGVLLALVALLTGSCREPAAPPGPPYLAVLSKVAVAPGVTFNRRLRFTVEELSGTLNIGYERFANPGDTLIFSVPPASYVVSLHDLPPTCTVLNGPVRFVALLDTDNTGTLRYNVQCVPSLTIEVLADGSELDTALVYRVSGPGIDRAGYVNLGGPDSMRTRTRSVVLDRLPGGQYEISLSHIAENCVLIDAGGARRVLDVPASGGATVAFRLRCSESALRPRILALASTYHDASSGFVLQVVDPDRDIRSYAWDLTNCRGKSVLPDGLPRVRRGLGAGRGYNADTLLVIGAFEAGIADSLMRGRCTAIHVEDSRGNLSEKVEQPIAASRSGRAPTVTEFNARLSGTTAIITSLNATDPDGDLAGVFVALRVRDGVLAPFDGKPDIGILDPLGFPDLVIPRIDLSTRIRWDDVYAVIVYVMDLSGNFRRLEDGDLFR